LPIRILQGSPPCLDKAKRVVRPNTFWALLILVTQPCDIPCCYAQSLYCQQLRPTTERQLQVYFTDMLDNPPAKCERESTEVPSLSYRICRMFNGDGKRSAFTPPHVRLPLVMKYICWFRPSPPQIISRIWTKERFVASCNTDKLDYLQHIPYFRLAQKSCL
jgi:hypothetical protein